MKQGCTVPVCLGILVIYLMTAALAACGWIATPWDKVVGPSYSSPSLNSVESLLGTDIFGRSVFFKVIHGARLAMSVGLVSVLVSIPLGTFLGAVAGYFGGWIDALIVWLYSTLASIPNIMILIAIAFVAGRGLLSVCIALAATSWIGLARVMRGEFIKHKSRDYVIAAESIGASHWARIFKHILPNTFHLISLHFSVQFVAAIKAEAILSFLGLGVQGQPSWGAMIDDARLEVSRGVWWPLMGTTLALFFIVLALNSLGDVLRTRDVQEHA